MANSAQKMEMDADTIADLLGVSRRQLTNYINNNDLPCTGERRTLTFSWPEVREWYVEYRISTDRRFGNDAPESEVDDEEDPGPRGKENLQQATLRKTRAEANLKELTLSKQRGQVVAIVDAKRRLDSLFSNLRTKLLGIPPKVAARLEGAKARTEREAILKSEMDNLCRELATGAIVDLPPDDAPSPEAPNA